VQIFLPSHTAGRNVLLDENNQAVCYILAGLTSWPPAMMTDLRKLRHLLDTNGIDVRAHYIRSAANV
jgi:S-formylglutathione hydrolase FrmB